MSDVQGCVFSGGPTRGPAGSSPASRSHLRQCKALSDLETSIVLCAYVLRGGDLLKAQETADVGVLCKNQTAGGT